MTAFQALDCPKCGGSIPANSKQCSYCGTYVRLTPDRSRLVIVGRPCPNCGADTEPRSRFCEKCGRILTRRCPACGRQINRGAVHCSHCGSNVADGDRQRAIEQAQQTRAQERAKMREWWNRIGVLFGLAGASTAIAACALAIGVTLFLMSQGVRADEGVLIAFLFALPVVIVVGTVALYTILGRVMIWRTARIHSSASVYTWACKQCGAVMLAGKKFCAHCGAGRPW